MKKNDEDERWKMKDEKYSHDLLNDSDLLKMNEEDYWWWMIQIIEGEWLKLSIRFIENEWFKLLKMND